MRKRHQRGYLRCAKRKKGPAVWEFLWREVGPNGQLVRRKTIIGTIDQYPTQQEASDAINGLRVSVNEACNRQSYTAVLMSELVDHYIQKELGERSDWYSAATKIIYRDFLLLWIRPHWAPLDIREVRTVAVEEWLRHLTRKDKQPLANSSKAKIRNLMSVLFNHAIRYEWLEQGKNPITHVRQSAARQTDPEILSPEEIRNLIEQLGSPFNLMVLLAATTGVRRSELLALQWQDIDFDNLLVHIRRSIFAGIVGKCKTHNSNKPLPLADFVARELRAWREKSKYNQPEDFIFASPSRQGVLPYSPNFLMSKIVRPAALRANLIKRITWHTFRHTFSTMLITNGEDIKVVQELMRHGTARITVEIYSQAISKVKRRAQKRIVRAIMSAKEKTTP
jgi:integrase